MVPRISVNILEDDTTTTPPDAEINKDINCVATTIQQKCVCPASLQEFHSRIAYCPIHETDQQTKKTSSEQLEQSKIAQQLNRQRCLINERDRMRSQTIRHATTKNNLEQQYAELTDRYHIMAENNGQNVEKLMQDINKVLHQTRKFRNDVELDIQHSNRIIQSSATALKPTFDPIQEFPEIYPDEMPNILPPMRKINHTIDLVEGASWHSAWKPEYGAFQKDVDKKLNKEEITGRSYRATERNKPRNYCTMFTIPKTLDPSKPRFLLDLRGRNKCTIKKKTPLPNIDYMLELVASKPFRSIVDLKDGYHNVRIIPEHEKFSAFLTHRGLWYSKVMQQGDCNAPATMMELMNEIFKDMLGNSVLVYLDNIVIFSDTYEDHVKHLREVHQRLLKEQFFLNKAKTQIMPERMEILGHVLTRDGLRAAPQKIKSILDFPIPQNKKELQRFLGMVIYLSRFCPRLSIVIAALTELTGKNDIDWEFTDEHMMAFNQCKELIAKDAVIQPINHASKQPIWLVCDASNIGIGAWIGQGPLDAIRPAQFFSKKFNSSQQNYTTYDQEMLAIVESLKRFRLQLMGHKFTVLTDHANLQYTLNHKPWTEKRANWLDVIQQFDCEIKHIRGAENEIADALSRVYLNTTISPSASDFILQSTDPNQAPRIPNINTAATSISNTHSPQLRRKMSFTNLKAVGRDNSHNNCAYNKCRGRSVYAGHANDCPFKDDDEDEIEYEPEEEDSELSELDQEVFPQHYHDHTKKNQERIKKELQGNNNCSDETVDYWHSLTSSSLSEQAENLIKSAAVTTRSQKRQNTPVEGARTLTLTEDGQYVLVDETGKNPEVNVKQFLADEKKKHALLSWTACYDDNCIIHRSEKDGSGHYPRIPQSKKSQNPCSYCDKDGHHIRFCMQ